MKVIIACSTIALLVLRPTIWPLESTSAIQTETTEKVFRMGTLQSNVLKMDCNEGQGTEEKNKLQAAFLGCMDTTIIFSESAHKAWERYSKKPICQKC